jgi:TM2 domain-containing membrane protein YozV
VVALLLSAFFGAMGMDRFYLDRTGTAVLKLLTFGGLGLWWLIDFILIVQNKLRDASGDALIKPEGT